jgi:hypothetical protein
MNYAYAQTGGQSISIITNANGLIGRIASIGNVVVYLLIALAVVYIVWSCVRYFIMGQSGDENRKAAGLQILWGIVGLFIILSIWGIVNLLLNTFGTNNNVPTDRIPNANFVSGQSNSNSSSNPGYNFHNYPPNEYGPN